MCRAAPSTRGACSWVASDTKRSALLGVDTLCASNHGSPFLAPHTGHPEIGARWFDLLRNDGDRLRAVSQRRSLHSVLRRVATTPGLHILLSLGMKLSRPITSLICLLTRRPSTVCKGNIEDATRVLAPMRTRNRRATLFCAPLLYFLPQSRSFSFPSKLTPNRGAAPAVGCPRRVALGGGSPGALGGFGIRSARPGC